MNMVVKQGDELFLDKQLEGLTVKEILIYYDYPQAFLAENKKGEKYIFSIIQKSYGVQVWLVVRIDSEAKEVNAYNIFKEPLDGVVYKVALFGPYQFVGTFNLNDICDEMLADKDVIFKIED